MAVSRGVLLFCLVTLFISLCFIKVTEAKSSDGCDGPDPSKGDQCREDASDEFADEDVDDTYKIVNKVAVSFTQRNVVNPEPKTEGGSPDAVSIDNEDANHVVVLGH
ncbi:hypothetical protein M0R45_032810 [Rubus argutus]|uniref:Uncharacterized protein n=1 Tax=Rubus argutus TaxID=59490 RepID=A0AAW1WIQ5_RUBAR